MIYITGDTHRDFDRLLYNDVQEGDTLIILGDAGINFYLDESDKELKKYLNKLGIKFFCVRGNHEERPENIKSYKLVDMYGGKVYIEKKYPNLIFAKDGEEYNIDNKSILVIGGAYSIDKNYRLIRGYPWFKDEQLNPEEMLEIINKVKGKHYDVVLTHTCPHKYEPTEVFLEGINQSNVDKIMEHFLDVIEESIDYDKWYCGHYHTEKKEDKIEFMYYSIRKFMKMDKNKELKNNH